MSGSDERAPDTMPSLPLPGSHEVQEPRQLPCPLGPYDLVEILGRGGAGYVYRAIERETGRVLAIKQLLDPDSADIQRRFKREIRVLQSLVSRHIVAYLDGVLDPAEPYIAMEFIEGINLAKYLAQQAPEPIPKDQIFRWARGLAAALEAAHKAGVVHRDIKPGNATIDTHGELVLLDFGLARADGKGWTVLTAEGAIMGTLVYLSPEQFAGAVANAASDVYQWGLMVYELLTLKRPYQDLDPIAGLQERCTKGVTLPPLSPEMQQLAQVVTSALRPAPEDRPQDGRALMQLLESALAPEPAQPDSARGEAAPAALLPGYRIIREVGKGGMGAVFEATNDRNGERVAIKLIRPEILGRPGMRQRLAREAKVLMSVFSPQVVRLLDYRETDAGLALILEFADGETLERRLQRGAFPYGNALDVIRKITAGIAELHRRGIIHRDIKPSNVMLTAHSGPKILDLGLARNLSDPKMTEDNQLVATPRYAPPEALAGRTPSPAGDVFQLGLVFYELLTARSDGRTQDVPDLLRGILLREKAFAGPEGADVLERTVRIFVQATAVSPLDRPADAGIFLKELDGIGAAWTAISRAVQPGKSASRQPDTLRTRSKSGAERSGNTSRTLRVKPAPAPPPVPEQSWMGLILSRLLTGVVVLALVLVVAAVVFVLPEMSGKLGR